MRTALLALVALAACGESPTRTSGDIEALERDRERLEACRLSEDLRATMADYVEVPASADPRTEDIYLRYNEANECVVIMSRGLAPGRDPPQTIADAVMTACSGPIERDVAVSASGPEPHSRTMWREKAIVFIVEQRAQATFCQQ